MLRRPESKLKVIVNNDENANKIVIKTQRTLGLQLVDRKVFQRDEFQYYGAGCFGDSRDPSAGTVRNVKERDPTKGKGKKGGKKGGNNIKGQGNLPVYQDVGESSTYIFKVVVDEEKRLF